MFTVFAVVGIATMVAMIVGLPLVLDYLSLGALGEWLVRVGSWVLLLLLLLLGLALLYRFGPSRVPARWHWVTPGSLAAAMLWTAVGEQSAMMASTVADNVSTPPPPLSASPSRKLRCLRARAAAIASAYT